MIQPAFHTWISAGNFIIFLAIHCSLFSFTQTLPQHIHQSCLPFSKMTFVYISEHLCGWTNDDREIYMFSVLESMTVFISAYMSEFCLYFEATLIISFDITSTYSLMVSKYVLMSLSIFFLLVQFIRTDVRRERLIVYTIVYSIP